MSHPTPRHRRAPAVTAVLTTFALSAAACSSSSAGGGGYSAPRAAGNAPDRNAAAEVLLQYVSFTPARVTIHAGQTVEWKWEDSPVPHNVSFQGFSSPTQSTGTYFHTFDTPGTFAYRCTVHQTMTGVVVVLP